MFFVIFSFVFFLPKSIRTIPFLVKYNHLLRNLSIQFYFHASFPTSLSVLNSNFCFRVFIWIQNQSWGFVFKFLFEFEIEASFPNYYSYSNSTSKIDSRILISIRFLASFPAFYLVLFSKFGLRFLMPTHIWSFISESLFEFEFKELFSNCYSYSNSNLKLSLQILIFKFIFYALLPDSYLISNSKSGGSKFLFESEIKATNYYSYSNSNPTLHFRILTRIPCSIRSRKPDIEFKLEYKFGK